MVENGKPEYVVMHYDDYAELIDRKSAESAADAAVSDIPDFTAETVLSGPNLPEDISKIRLEDLPLWDESRMTKDESLCHLVV